MIVCHVCGTENPDGSKFCEGCGVELQAPVVSLDVGNVAAAPEVAAPAPIPPALEVAIAPAVEAIEPVIAPPPLPSDEAALDIDATPAVAEAAPVVEAPPLAPAVEAPPLATVIEEAPAAVVAPVAVLGSTLDGSVNPKATIESPIPNAAKIARLIPRGSGGEGHVLHSERMVVGRFDPSAGPVDIDLSGGQGENYISRRHAEVYLENGAWLVRDLGSTNGVYVKRAGQAQYSPRIIEPQALADGDEVAFGNMKFLFAMSDGA